MRWRLQLEEFDLTFHYIQGEKNVVADALSRLPINESSSTDDAMVAEEVFDMYEPEWRKFYQPITIAEISREQKKDTYTQQLHEKAPDRLGELFEDIGKKSGPDFVTTEIDPVDKKTRIIVPQSMTRRLIQWYHTMLVHPGAERLHNTLRQHYTWKNMQQEIREFVKKCQVCQKAKRGVRGRGMIPPKDAETEPWKDIAVDLSGPWKATIDGGTVNFHTLTIIDVFTGWVEIIPIDTKKMESISSLLEREWLRRYPRPSRVLFDAGGEFNNQAFQALLTKWFIKPEPITVKNPTANAIVERMHQVLGNMLRAQLVKTYGQEDVVAELTSAAAFGIRASMHGTNKATPAQLVYGKDLILRTQMETNLELIRSRREAAIHQNNRRENKRRIPYKYKAGDKVLILATSFDPKLQLHDGPYKVLAYNTSNGILHIQRKGYVEPISIRRVRPYFGS